MSIEEDVKVLKYALLEGPAPGPYVRGHGNWGAQNDDLGSSCYEGILGADGNVIALVVEHNPDLGSNPDTRVNAAFFRACTPERIHHLLSALEAAQRDADAAHEALACIGDFAHDKSTGPAVPDALWEVRSMAYDAVQPAIAATGKEG